MRFRSRLGILGQCCPSSIRIQLRDPQSCLHSNFHASGRRFTPKIYLEARGSPLAPRRRLCIPSRTHSFCLFLPRSPSLSPSPSISFILSFSLSVPLPLSLSPSPSLYIYICHIRSFCGRFLSDHLVQEEQPLVCLLVYTTCNSLLDRMDRQHGL